MFFNSRRQQSHIGRREIGENVASQNFGQSLRTSLIYSIKFSDFSLHEYDQGTTLGLMGCASY
jgi:hypothetical protein